jgi:hypothetical protein
MPTRGLRGFGRERGVVHRSEQLFHFPGTESQILAIELNQFAGDEHPRRIDAWLATARQDHPDLPRSQLQEAFQRLLSPRTVPTHSIRLLQR